MIIETQIIIKILEQFSVKIKNKTAKTDIDLNFTVLNFYLFLKTKTKVNRILLKIILN